MPAEVSVKNIGLRGVAVADTKISFIDGQQGILIYRGYRIEELAERSSFMEVAYLLLKGYLPSTADLEIFNHQVMEARALPDYIFTCLKAIPKSANPMDVLQAAVPMLAMDDSDLSGDSREQNEHMAIRLIARLPAVTAAWERIRNGMEPLPPDRNLTHAENFLWQLTGRIPDAEMARDLDTCLTLHADHTFNASTFACREVTSTRAHMYAAVTAGIGALSGSLHGGANTRVMAMLLELEHVQDIEPWIKDRINRGDRIMGMGHAVYKTMDPRAKYLKEMATRLAKKTGQAKWDYLSKTVERLAVEEFDRRGKSEIRPNVDFYSAPVYHMMGIPRDLFTPIFAISRIAGWCSHVIEEKFAEAQEKPMLYRPQAEYVGQYCGLMGCVYEPAELRH
ncbi:MAG: citrate (Si)-synthase [Desulfomonile tiedjei]|uniref:Citrate synthase n=1 Tax=Desulfomonile tiedjei TaxID=2358 RepID=A0A9D6Z569_9BACT|nr:citrate (Si)-synthase [Desulfomonile tiedjei]